MDFEPLLAATRRLVDDGHTPAAQVAVACEGQVLCFATFGNATDHTRFMVFSATKPIVASAVWLLIGERMLEVERPVAHYIPEFATHGKQAVTVEQVLLHTAGFPNAALDPVEGGDAVTRAKRFTEWALEWEPGTRFEYHALSAHWVLAELIERVTGEDFRDFIERRLCEPLGLPPLLGLAEDDQDDIADGVRIGDPPPDNPVDVDTLKFNDPAVRNAGVPGGGGIMTAATMARFYQALLHNPDGLWDRDVLHDATSNVRCRFPDPLINVPANRSLGLVLAGDDGLQQFRYALFGKHNSPGAFGHAGAHSQVAWADPATGISFALFKNGLEMDLLRDAGRILPISDLASALH